MVILKLVLHLSLMVAPDADFAICVEVNILQVLHLALPHGRVSPSGSSSRMSGLSFAHIRRSRRLWISIGAGERQSVLSSVKLQTTKEETRLLKKRQKKLKALGINHVVDPPTGNSIKCKKPRNRRFFRHKRREETSKAANDTPVLNLSSVDLTELKNRLLIQRSRFLPPLKEL